MIFCKETLDYVATLDKINEARKKELLNQFSEPELSLLPMFWINQGTPLSSNEAFLKFKTEKNYFSFAVTNLCSQGLIGESSEGFNLTLLGLERSKALQENIFGYLII